MMAEYVQREIEGNVARVTIDRPDVHNAFNEVVIAELRDAFAELGADDRVRVIVLASSGKSFSAGADIVWMKRMVDYSIEENIKDATDLANMLRAIRDCPKPTIARVQGATFGGGVGLVAACDLSVVVRDAIFCLSEVKLGIVPAVISPYLMEKIGPGATRRFALTAERFDANEAQRVGLVTEVVDFADDLDPWIGKRVEWLSGNSPKALAVCKKTMTEVASFAWDEVQRLTTRRIAELRVSDEGQEGLNAFLDKRKPNWVTR